MSRKAWLLPLAVTLVLSWLALRHVRLVQLWDLLSGAQLRWVPALAALVLLEMILRAKRWALLLARGLPPNTRELFKIDSIGAAINNILFLRLGELARGLLAARRLSVPLATVLSSIAVERLLDLSALLAIFTVASTLSQDLVAVAMRQIAFVLLVAALSVLAVLTAAERLVASGGFFERVLQRWSCVHKLVCELSAGAMALRSAVCATQAILFSLAFWAIDALYYWVAARCLDLSPPLTYAHAMLVVSWAGAGSALPSAPGAFGPFEVAVKAIVTDMGVENTQAFGYAFLSHIIAYAIVTVIGLIFLYRTGIPLAGLRGEISRRSAEEAITAAP